MFRRTTAQFEALYSSQATTFVSAAKVGGWDFCRIISSAAYQ